jgi:hypothetical protein
MRCYIGNNNIKTLLEAPVPPVSPGAFFFVHWYAAGDEAKPPHQTFNIGRRRLFEQPFCVASGKASGVK